MVTALPAHLRSERALAEYFDGIHLGAGGEGDVGLGVESVTVVRAVGGMKELLERRTRALRRLEVAWCRYVGNPVEVKGPNAVFGFDASKEVERIWDPVRENTTRDDVLGSPEVSPNGALEGRLIDFGNVENQQRRREQDEMDDEADLEARLLSPETRATIITNRPRPTIRPNWFARKVDALDWYAEQFRIADEDVKKRRRGKFRPTGVAFVTFDSLAAAVSHIASLG